MIDLSILPKEAQNELYDFYQFLLERYGLKKQKELSRTKLKKEKINAFFDGYNLDLTDFKFNRNEIYER